MKKIICLFMAIVLVIICPMSVYATEAVSELSDFGNYGILITEDGSQYMIKGTIVENKHRSVSEEQVSITYRYDIPTTFANGGSNTVYENDGGYASTVYLTIHYKSQNMPKEYLLTRVTGYWVVTDGKASVESASLNYVCKGFFPKPVDQEEENIPVNNHFSVNTGFSTYVASDLVAAIGASLTVNYLMGTSRRWSFTLQNNLAID